MSRHVIDAHLLKILHTLITESSVSRTAALLGQSQPVDPESVLSAAFITADVGKLYLILAKSLGRAVEH